MKKNTRIEDDFAQLEQIVEEMESSKQGIEENIKSLKIGLEISARLTTKLEKLKSQVEALKPSSLRDAD